MNIEFTPNEWYDHQRRKVVWFKAVADDKTIDCGVTIQALFERFGAYADNPLPQFAAHRQLIWDAAAQLIAARRFDNDGRIIVRSADIGVPKHERTVH